LVSYLCFLYIIHADIRVGLVFANYQTRENHSFKRKKTVLFRLSGERLMKKVSKLAVGIALVTCGLASASAFAEVSYNAGFASEYYFRGILQKAASASAGVTLTENGFFAGGWTGDVGDGLEVDGFFGYGITSGDFTASAGMTGYYYTGQFDDTYQEFNLKAGYKILSVEYSNGEYDGFGTPADYDFLGLTLSQSGFHGTFGSSGKDFAGDYFEVGYDTSISEIDFGLDVIFSSDELSDQLDSSGKPDASQALVFTVSKTW